MKKIIVVITFIMLGVLSVNAQKMSENAIGLRFTENSGFGAEFSYQRQLSRANRLEIDLGIRGNSSYNSFKATGLYEWVNHLDGNFNWYLGAGGGLGSWNIKNSNSSDSFIFAAGVVGIEYDFDIPIMIALDFRPEIGFSDYYDGFNADFGLAIRYQF